ncbi:MAG: phage virion morphogenesis protein [Bacteroidetes bacterium]|nr:phage virion morphogenesis protein [Bacteroidota bacterium]MBS1672120.1 phage virion morphogenesis protein [Bacteroidota bacterium]
MILDNKNINGLDDVIRKLQNAKDYLQKKVTTVIGVEAVKHFKNNFQLEGFIDSALKKWESRKIKRLGSTDNQKILSKSGELADSIDFRIELSTIIIYSDKIYAQIHNEGGKITVTDKMRKYFWAMYYLAKKESNTIAAEQYKGMALAKVIVMPKRKFMGDSAVLNEAIRNKLMRDLNRILTA